MGGWGRRGTLAAMTSPRVAVDILEERGVDVRGDLDAGVTHQLGDQLEVFGRPVGQAGRNVPWECTSAVRSDRTSSTTGSETWYVARTS